MNKIQKAGTLFAGTALVAASLLMGVIANGQTTPIACTMSAASVIAGNPIVLTASGGSGSYIWSSPALTIGNPTGTSFTAVFNAPGTYPVRVTSSDGLTTTCNVLVVAPGGGIVIPTPTPTLPNTGELPEVAN